MLLADTSPRLSYVPKGPSDAGVLAGQVEKRCRVVLVQVPWRDDEMAGRCDKRLASVVVMWRSSGVALVDTRKLRVLEYARTSLACGSFNSVAERFSCTIF